MKSDSKAEILVSIVIPVYKGSNFVAQAIESALAQTYTNIEIIVVNDGSPDGGRTKKACEPYMDKIQYIEKENGGVSTALNLAIKTMKGQYFSWLSHDDLYLPTKIERNLQAIEACSSEIVVPYSDYEYINSNSSIVKKTYVKSNECAMVSVLMGNINGLSLLIHRSCFEKVGLFDEKETTIQDYKLYFELAKHYRFVHTQEILVASRIHGAQQGKEKYGEHIQRSDRFFVSCLQELEANFLQTLPTRKSKIFFDIAYRHRRNGYKQTEKTALKMAFRYRNSRFDYGINALAYRVKTLAVFYPWLVLKFLYGKIRKLS